MDEWEALHQGTGREGIDSPSHFDLRGLRQIARLNQPSRPEPPPPEPSPPESPPPEPRSSPPKFPRRALVRPYTRTGGRTRPRQELALEALVMTTARGLGYAAMASPEERFICELCVEAYSIAEIAAYARLPIGVVKVIVDDLSTAGAVEIRQPGLVLADSSSYHFMSRLLEGLRSL